ncbi:SDR family NAD(P)-dependent oxidoreductase, partial [Mesorhizobium sp. M0119]|uniref:SDR family NAD(P)-dependent oxidoreductase n=1 Tax=Mesorhizobium sp. M0119 TaxID=2956885 RepID=UPI00333AE0EF
MTAIPSVLITGASTGIGASYADRFARRGHDLVLVARDTARMEALSARLRQETGVAIDIVQADLTQPTDLATVETMRISQKPDSDSAKSRTAVSLSRGQFGGVGSRV